MTFILKLLFVAGLLYFLGKKGMLSADATLVAFKDWQHMTRAYVLMTLSTLIGIVRWHMLLKTQDIKISFLRTLQLSFVGNFFNVALPGAVSGDFVKAVYVAKEVGGQRSKAFSSILIDRVIGLSALVIVAVVGLGFSLHFDWGQNLLGALQVFIAVAGLCVVVFFSYLFFVPEKHDVLLRVFVSLQFKFKIFGSITRIYEGLRHYQNKRTSVVVMLLMSIVIHTFVVLANVQFAHALAELAFPELALFVIVPLGMLVTAVPLTPAGVGTGHAAFAYLFGLISFGRGADIFNLFIVYQLLVGTIGGMIYLRFKSKKSFRDVEQELTSS